MNQEIPALLAEVAVISPRTRIVAHVYDSVLLEVPTRQVGAVEAVVRNVTSRPVTIASSGTARTCVLPIDLDVSDRWH
jgi:hypothetical protein